MEGNSLLLFFGLSIVLQNIAALVFTPNSRGYDVLGDVVRIGNVAMTGNRIAALVVAGTTCIAIAAFLTRNASPATLRVRNAAIAMQVVPATTSAAIRLPVIATLPIRTTSPSTS